MDETENTVDTSTESPAVPLPDLESTEATAGETTDVTANETPSDEEDPIAAAIQAALAQEADKLTASALARAREEATQREAEDKARREAAEEATRLSNSFAEALRESYATAKQRIKFVDDEGREQTLADDVFEDVFVKPMQKFNSTAEKAYQLRIFGSLAQSAMELLPDDEAREKFSKEAANQPLPVWLRKLSEAFAPHSEHAKSISKEVATKVTAAEARGFVKGQKAPTGTPRTDGGRSQGSNQPDLSTAFGIADAKSKGLITSEEFSTAWRKLQS